MQWNLIRIRRENGETQSEIAKLLDISTEGYRTKENGKSQFKSDEMFLIAEHFGLGISEIFCLASMRNANKQHRKEIENE